LQPHSEGTVIIMPSATSDPMSQGDLMSSFRIIFPVFISETAPKHVIRYPGMAVVGPQPELMNRGPWIGLPVFRSMAGPPPRYRPSMATAVSARYDPPAVGFFQRILPSSRENTAVCLVHLARSKTTSSWTISDGCETSSWLTTFDAGVRNSACSSASGFVHTVLPVRRSQHTSPVPSTMA